MGDHRPAIALCTFLSTLSMAHGLSFVAPPVPEAVLDTAAIARDSSDLIGYFEFGFPTSGFLTRPLPNGAELLVFDRFYYYQFVAKASANKDDRACIPVLQRIRSGDFPAVLQADLDLFIASQAELVSWTDWDDLIRVEQDSLSVDASVALESISGEPAVAFLEQLLKTWTGTILNPSNNSFVSAHQFRIWIRLCEEVTRRGSNSGLAALIRGLDSTDITFANRSAIYLRMWTGEFFGPYSDTPVASRERDAGFWKSWWTANQSGFTVDPRSFRGTLFLSREMPRATTVRDHLWRSIDGDLYSWPYFDDEERAWLGKEVLQRPDLFEQIVRDQTERTEIRAIALGYLVGAIRESRYSILLECLADAPSAPDGSVFRTASRLIKEYYPDRHIDVLKSSVENECPSASIAAQELAKSPEGAEFLARSLPVMSVQLRKSTLNTLFFLDVPPVYAVEFALAYDDPVSAAKAILAARSPSILAVISPEARASIAQWSGDPWCAYWVAFLGRLTTPPSLDFKQAMDAQRTPTPPSAALHAMVMRELGGSQAKQGFKRAVDAYRSSRGRSASLAELGYP